MDRPKWLLSGVERSIENWKIIQPLCPAYQKEISHLLVVLEQLRSDADEYFPKARTFVRPGSTIDSRSERPSKKIKNKMNGANS